MLIIPAIDLKKDRVVRLYKGDFNRINYYESSPEDTFLEYLEAGIKRLHVIFLWAAFSGSISGEEEGVIDRILKIRDNRANKECAIQVGGGMRTFSIISGLLSRGIDRVITGTAFLIPLAIEEGFTKNDIKMFYQEGGKEFKEEKEVPEYDLMERIGDREREKILVAIDYRNEETALSGWQVTVPLTPQHVIKNLMKKGYRRFILTNVEKDGTLEGVDTDPIEKIIDRLAFSGEMPEEIIISGGVSSHGDIVKLQNLNPPPHGVVVGKALYQKKFDLKSAIEKYQ